LLVRKSEFNNDFVTIGTIKEPFGTNGLVKVKLFCENTKIFKTNNYFLVGKNRLSTGIELKKQIDQHIWLARFSFTSSREEILNHKGELIICSKDLLPALDGNEYYYFDLIGMSIKNKQDSRKGFVKNVVNYGSGDLLEVKLEEIQQTYFIPFDEENVTDINLSLKKIIINPQKGLLPKN
tara:strand:- start:668 stop:1207 length:540 start_codon:yes stop_codon:yes gene_type:complete